jgi:hypothetical protein
MITMKRLIQSRIFTIILIKNYYSFLNAKRAKILNIVVILKDISHKKSIDVLHVIKRIMSWPGCAVDVLLIVIEIMK